MRSKKRRSLSVFDRFITELDTRLGGRPLPDERVVVALSGGADSTCLLALLARLRDTRPFTLTAVHINHHARADDADADAAFCNTLCAGLDVPLHIESLEPSDPALQHAIARFGRENAWRAARYRILHDYCRFPAGHVDSPQNARYCEPEPGLTPAGLWLAHHADDQAETVLLRLFRGGALKSLAAMRPLTRWSDGIDRLRPLLNFSKRELIGYLEEEGLRFVHDATNADPDENLRAALRETVIPTLESALGRSIGGPLRRLADQVAGWTHTLPPAPDDLTATPSAGMMTVRIERLADVGDPLALHWILDAVRRRWHLAEPAADPLMTAEIADGIVRLLRAPSAAGLTELNWSDHTRIRREDDRLVFLFPSVSGGAHHQDGGGAATAPCVNSEDDGLAMYDVPVGKTGRLWSDAGVGYIAGRVVSLEAIPASARVQFIREAVGPGRLSAVFDRDALGVEPIFILSKFQHPAPRPKLPRGLRNSRVPVSLRPFWPVMYGADARTGSLTPLWSPWAIRHDVAHVNRNTGMAWWVTFVPELT